MNRCYPFQGVGSSGAPPTSLSRWGSLTELLRRYALTHLRFIWCWRPRNQIVSVSLHATVGWTATDPSVHTVLKASSWRVSVLFKHDHRIDRRFPPMDRRFIWRCFLCGSSSPIHPTQQGTGPSVHPTVSSWLQSLRSVPSAPTLCTDGTVGSSNDVFFLPSFRVFNLDICFNLTYLTCQMAWSGRSWG
jgi:hypothetical protein